MLKCQKFQKIDENTRYKRRQSSYRSKYFRNVNEIYRKNVPYDNIKSHTKAGLYPLIENTVSEKP